MSRRLLRQAVAEREAEFQVAQRALEADLRRTKAAARTAVTPDRIVVGGLLLGLGAGLLRPGAQVGRLARGAKLAQVAIPSLIKLTTTLISAVAAMRASQAAGAADHAADEATDAADEAEEHAEETLDGAPAGAAAGAADRATRARAPMA
ncbi:hypothetical protein [Coralloluteibacterium thermophilus]|uniref:Uncharacterized protein n=1 Tax=Coralloluteibacterium thermophilum TaxID=2707049 RepID=A0ABV9NFS2_9GAMM